MLVFLKLGGSLITDKRRPFTPREEEIRNIARNIKRALDGSPNLRVLVGHGSGSFGHYPAKKYRVKEGIIDDSSWKGYAETRAAASKLNQLVTEIFLEEGINAVSLQPSSSVIAENGKVIYMDIRAVEFLLENGQVPIVYGDAVLDKKLGCTIASTEDIFAYLAHRLKPSKIILAGLVPVYTADPIEHPDAELIPEISDKNFEEIKEKLTGSYGIDVTGGMFSKVEKMYSLAKQVPGLEIYVISGKDDNIYRVLKGESSGTRIFSENASAPGALVIDINGVLLPKEKRPWLIFLEKLHEQGYISDEDWEVIQRVAGEYLSHKISRDDAVRIITHIYASSLQGRRYSEILDIARRCAEELFEYFNEDVLNVIERFKEKGYVVVLITGNFWEIAEWILKRVGAHKLLAVKLHEEDGIITGELENRLMDSHGKYISLKNFLASQGIPKHKVVYIGDDVGDWKCISELAGFGVLYNPDLRTESVCPEYEHWVEEVRRFARNPEENHVYIVHPRYGGTDILDIL